MTARVIGIGHPDRGDDVVGVLVAAAVARRRPCGVAVATVDGSPLGLLSTWDASDEVIVADAVGPGGVPGHVERFDATARSLPSDHASGGTHDGSLADAVELARALGRLPRRLIIYGIHGRRFELGASPTPAVLAAVEPLAAAIVADLGR